MSEWQPMEGAPLGIPVIAHFPTHGAVRAVQYGVSQMWNLVLTNGKLYPVVETPRKWKPMNASRALA